MCFYLGVLQGANVSQTDMVYKLQNKIRMFPIKHMTVNDTFLRH